MRLVNLRRLRRACARPQRTRPSECWTMLSKAQKLKAIAEWEAFPEEEKQRYRERVIATPVIPKPKTDNTVYPAMPLCVGKGKDSEHRDKLDYMPIFNVLVARSVNRAELEAHPQGREAIEKEWGSHRKRGTWDESAVCEWSEVSKQ